MGAVTEELRVGNATVPLSRREVDAVGLVAAGATPREISESLGIGEASVETLLARVYAKLGVHGRAEAVAAAHDLGLL